NQLVDLVARIDDDRLARPLAAEDEAVLVERRHRANFDDHALYSKRPQGPGLRPQGWARPQPLRLASPEAWGLIPDSYDYLRHRRPALLDQDQGCSQASRHRAVLRTL